MTIKAKRKSSRDIVCSEHRTSETVAAIIIITTASHRSPVQSIFILLTGLATCVFADDGCDVYGCYESIRGVFGFSDHQLVFPFYSDPQLDEICRAFAESRECIDRTIGECDLSERISFESFDQTVRFLCTEALQAYQKERFCFVSDVVLSSAKSCNYTYHTQLNELKRRQKTTQQKATLLCSHVDELVTCLRDGVTEHCGSEAGELIFSLQTTIQRPVKEGIGCSGLADESAHSPVVVFVVVIGALVLIALLPVSAILRRSTMTSSRGGNFCRRRSNDCRGCCSCCGCCSCVVGRPGRRSSGRMQLMETTTKMKISSVESEYSATCRSPSCATDNG